MADGLAKLLRGELPVSVPQDRVSSNARVRDYINKSYGSERERIAAMEYFMHLRAYTINSAI